MTRVHIHPTAEQVRDDNGIGRIILAQHRLLPDLGIELVGRDEAEVIACHIEQGDLPRVDVLHVHGLYWQEDAARLGRTHHETNRRVIAAARRARAITVPSDWVAGPFRRDMRLLPEVIGHGLDLAEWSPGVSRGYALWNKNRAGTDACDPTPAYELARRGVSVVSTFAPAGMPIPPSMIVTGAMPHQRMKEFITGAEVYLATVKETFGIGTLEALACGVPVLGYRHGGTADIVEHERTGYLVEPGDIDGLMTGMAWIQEHRRELSANALEAVKSYGWTAIMERYAALYRHVAEERTTEQPLTSVVITCYNYGRWVGQAIDSVLIQTVPVEVVVVNDGSTDDSAEVIDGYAARQPIKVIHQENQGVAAARNNGIKEATGDYIICLDADDRLAPRAVELLLPAMVEDRSLGIAYGGLVMFDEKGQRTFPSSEFSWEAQSQVSNPPVCYPPCASMFRRSMWERTGGYIQAHAPGEDAEFWTRGLSVGFTAKRVTTEPTFWYRAHSNGAHLTKQYKAVDTWHPWMRDRLFPMAAPQTGFPIVRSYSAPVVSVIIPVGPGHARYLPAAIDSLLGQTVREWEAIIVNDTGDDLGEVLRPYPFCRVIQTGGSVGAGLARNLGIEQARAPLLLFLDADDYLDSTTIEKMLRAYIASNGERYVYSDWWLLKSEGISPQRCPDYDARAWLHKGQHAVTALVPTDWSRRVGGFPDLPGWEDWGFFIRLAVAGGCGLRVPEPLLYYRYHTGARRAESFQRQPELMAWIDREYGAYRRGEMKMAGCGGCGKNGAGVLAAKQALGLYRSLDEGGHMEGQVPEGWEILRYKGTQMGEIRYNGVAKGRHYDVAKGWQGTVHPDDVPRLLGTTRFERVPAVVPVVEPSQTPAAGEAAPIVEEVPVLPDSESLLLGLDGIGPTVAEAMETAGFRTLRDVSTASDEQLLAISGIGQATLKKIREQLQ